MNLRKIKELRQKLELSQQQAAERAGMTSRQHWNNIENGSQGTISVAQLEAIARVLGVRAADLLD